MELKFLRTDLNHAVVEIQNAVREFGDNLEKYQTLGNIKVFKKDRLLIFHYNRIAMEERTWADIERVSRGLIIDIDTQEIVARPFDKFFCDYEMNFQYPELTNFSEVTRKMDGSLGILYRQDGKFKVATRKGFDSEQALWATKFINNTAKFDLEVLPEPLTLMLEIIYPDNRVVVNYGYYEDVVLIGARNRFTGTDYGHSYLRTIGEYTGLTVVSLDDQIWSKTQLNDRAAITTGTEGWVIRWPSGLRVKVKTKEYVVFHKILSRLTESNIRDALIVNPDGWYTLMNSLTGNLFLEAQAMTFYINKKASEREYMIRGIFESLKPLSTIRTRKDFALHVNKNYPEYASELFELYKGNPIRKHILKYMKLDNKTRI